MFPLRSSLTSGAGEGSNLFFLLFYFFSLIMFLGEISWREFYKAEAVSRYVILTKMITRQQIMVFKHSADTLYSKSDFTSATILYFKTLFAMQDFLLLERAGESPKDHSERFRKLEKHFPDLEFPTYKDTYSKIIDKETCERIRKMVENDIKRYDIK